MSNVRTKNPISLRNLKLLNLVVMSAIFWLLWTRCGASRLYEGEFLSFRNIAFLAAFVLLYFAFSRIYNAFSVVYCSVRELILSQFLTVLFANSIIFLVTAVIFSTLDHILPFFITLCCQTAFAVVWCCGTHALYFKYTKSGETYIIYDMQEGMENTLNEHGLDKRYKVVGTCTAQECLEKNMSMLTGNVHTVFFSGVHSHDRNIILKYCIENHISCFIIPRVGDLLMSSALTMNIMHLPMLYVSRYTPNPEYVIIKRAFDIFASAVGLILASPFMAVIALAVRSDGGPAIYRQTRLTKDGKEFQIMKFRSMRTDAEKDGVARLSTGDNDDRVTRVGRIIRMLRLDELPQLINVFRGDMSLVGPRPERPEIAAQYEAEMPEFRLRLQAKAGITGYAQVYGQYNTTPYHKLQLDLMYIAHPSLLQDLKILFATVKIIFMKDSTEGVAEGQTTAMDYKNAADSTGKYAETVSK